MLVVKTGIEVLRQKSKDTTSAYASNASQPGVYVQKSTGSLEPTRSPERAARVSLISESCTSFLGRGGLGSPLCGRIASFPQQTNVWANRNATANRHSLGGGLQNCPGNGLSVPSCRGSRRPASSYLLAPGPLRPSSLVLFRRACLAWD